MDNPLAHCPSYMYEIHVEGRLTEDWSEWFGGLSIQAQGESVTVLRGRLPDQSALLGVLYKIHSLNLGLVSVSRCEIE